MHESQLWLTSLFFGLQLSLQYCWGSARDSETDSEATASAESVECRPQEIQNLDSSKADQTQASSE